jgi:uncharacterized membrane protein
MSFAQWNILDAISLLCLIITFRDPISTVQQLNLFIPIMRPEVGYDSSVGTTTRYRLDGLEIEYRWG